MASSASTRLTDATPENRLALEMAINEELERSELDSEAEAVTGDLAEQEEIAAIADDLLIPDAVMTRLKREQDARESPDVDPAESGPKRPADRAPGAAKQRFNDR